MSAIIEGEWKNFDFKMVRPENVPKVLAHLRANFYHSTPLTQGLAPSEEYLKEFDQVYRKVLQQNLSFYALDKSTNEIAGARITFIQDKALEKELADLDFKTPQMKIMNKIMGQVNTNANIYDTYGITSFINFYTASVDPKYQGQGLASEMYERSFSSLRVNNKYKGYYAKSNLTSPYSRHILHNKFGFNELARVYFNDFRDEDGNPLLKGRSDDDFVCFSCLRLE